MDLIRLDEGKYERKNKPQLEPLKDSQKRQDSLKKLNEEFQKDGLGMQPLH